MLSKVGHRILNDQPVDCLAMAEYHTLIYYYVYETWLQNKEERRLQREAHQLKKEAHQLKKEEEEKRRAEHEKKKAEHAKNELKKDQLYWDALKNGDGLNHFYIKAWWYHGLPLIDEMTMHCFGIGDPTACEDGPNDGRGRSPRSSFDDV